jgi:gliding motility-associated-like protein
MKKTILLLLLTLITLNGYAQFSKTHYIPPIVCQNALAEDQYIYISTPSLSNVNFKIFENGGTVITGTVNNTNPYRYSIGTGNTTRLITPKTQIGIISNKGYTIEAEDLVYVSVRVNSSRNSNNSYNHAGGLVSKGNSALGKEFRLGAMLNPLFDGSLLNFASILSTENGTKITISNIPTGTILSNGTIVTGPITATLNKNESYVLALENTNNTISNSSKMIGALVESDKPVVVNSGSFAGSNSTLLSNGNPTGRDVGFDQIVPFEKTGTAYIFVKGVGTNELERVLLIAHNANTVVYINGSTTPYTTLVNAGDYVVIDGSQFSNGNLYVTTSEKVFSYQSIGGLAPTFNPNNGLPTNNPIANQNLFFVPPLNCATPNSVDNIPEIESIGDVAFNGGLNIVTETGATVSINNTPITVTPVEITGNPDFVRYTINGLTGNIAVKSTRQVYVSYFGTNGAATYGGYYSGFDSKPEIGSNKINIDNTSCIPNIELKVSAISPFTIFEWFFNDVAIPNSNINSYVPTQPGYYQVKGSIPGCLSVFSDKIPVSNCPANLDNDFGIDNIDIDNDNDGITNCTESYGNQNINISNLSNGNINVGNYSNSFTGNVTASSISNPLPFTGSTDGSFISEIPAGKNNWATYQMNFNQPISIGMEYIANANPTDLLNSEAEYIVNSDIDKTITVLNPNNQLLIDTNYDGIYESGVTQFSSFEIKFRLNSTIPLAAGTGTFQFLTYLTNSIRFTHINLSDTNNNKSSLRFLATCVPKDTDSDGIADQLDSDSDNDGIPDTIESQGNVAVALSNSDINNDGLDNSFGTGFTPVDTDNDGIPDYLDLDSDNDGIYDVVETGSNNTDTDNDGIKNYRDLDSDNDLCSDVIEAGFTDSNTDGILGAITPPTININGQVSSGIGYTTPNNNYIISAPIVISSQPVVPPTCDLQNTSVSITANGDSYQWQLSTDGTTWNSIIDNVTYSGATTTNLTINRVTNTMNGYKYRVFINRNGNSCGLLSAETTLTVYVLPALNITTLKQCDDDIDGITDFNLTEKNSFISVNYDNETFTYYTTQAGATNADTTAKITNPTVYRSGNKTIWVRVENTNGCFNITSLLLSVSTTQIPTSFSKIFSVCDDYIDDTHNDIDGIATFDFSTTTSDILAMLPAPTSSYMIKYYKNEADALSEKNEISNSNDYRNDGYPNQQAIWIRVESTSDNACYGLGPHVQLIVNAKPNINTNEDQADDEFVCLNLPNYFAQLNSGILDGSPTSNYTYIWTKDGAVLPNKTAPTLDVNTAGIYTVEVINVHGCSRIRTINVATSDIAHIQNIDIVDLADSNSVTVSVTGIGNYTYSLDEPNGPFQSSNFFENVAAGFHIVYVNDENNCGTLSQKISIIGIPKFFTPNGDGYNDYWNVKGVSSDFNSNSSIIIFDRYGKLIKQITTSSPGWDGTMNGHPLPSDDYWYMIKLEDGREAKGHFSLKR